MPEASASNGRSQAVKYLPMIYGNPEKSE